MTKTALAQAEGDEPERPWDDVLISTGGLGRTNLGGESLVATGGLIADFGGYPAQRVPFWAAQPRPFVAAMPGFTAVRGGVEFVRPRPATRAERMAMARARRREQRWYRRAARRTWDVLAYPKRRLDERLDVWASRRCKRWHDDEEDE